VQRGAAVIATSVHREAEVEHQLDGRSVARFDGSEQRCVVLISELVDVHLLAVEGTPGGRPVGVQARS
jgi:hypothetical protein